MPIINTFIFPTFITILTFVTTFVHSSNTSAQHIAIAAMHKEKKIFAVNITPTPTGTIKHHIIGIGHHGDKDDKTTTTPTITPTTIPTDVPTATPTITTTQTTPTNTPSNTTVTAKSTITVDGKTIHLSMKYQSAGGAITGSISGDCSGSANGTFNASTQSLSGTAKASCSAGILSIPVQINFTGHLLSTTKAAIHYSVSAAGQQTSGDTTLSLQ